MTKSDPLGRSFFIVIPKPPLLAVVIVPRGF
ncbi:rfbP protein, partial [Vibrio cholerae]|nr:rfbP protein [Vibrio cholerae]MVB16174.1 rfbP protein [Vibrio cholerae]MVB20023.1 rfbP protein [Vibrio cholerae]MVB32691.1 rfbP protein [Vibrio cholerae]MVB44218.1 rfbP protein [Vibrio cholerae]